MQEVSRVRSTHGNRNLKLAEPMRKGQIQREKLHPQYVIGFIDGEGSFSVSINKHPTLKSGIEVKNASLETARIRENRSSGGVRQ